MNLFRQLPLFLTVACLSQTVMAESAQDSQQNAIDAYVAKPDAEFKWEVAEITVEDGYESVAIDLTSQRWLTEEVVDRPIWQHRLILTVPDQLHTNDIAFLYITGGSNTAEPRTVSGGLVQQIAQTTGTVVAELRQVPNQPLVFHGDGEDRYEDDLIAYAWTQYLENEDPEWLPRGPMVKSAVRAMDAIHEFMAQHRDGAHAVNRFVVGGGSKRGWTTWLTGAMDDRVVAIVPIVIDVLNIDVSMQHHFAAYGYWAPSIGDYVRHGIMHRRGDARLDQIYELVDPLNYAERIEMPQFVVNGSRDQFFLPDSSQFYWDQLSDPKYLRYVPNADHGLGNSDGGESVAAFHFAVTRGLQLPEITWNYVSNDVVDVTFATPPDSITLWQATNEDFRDFRIETLGPGYESTSFDATAISPNTKRRFTVDTPSNGWKAWFLEMTYDIGFVRPLKLSTEIRVTPSKLPFEGKASNLPTSITFVLHNVESTEGLFDAVSGLLTSGGIGSDLSIATQDNRTYLNFLPSDMQLGYFTMVNFLRERFGADVQATLQLESGVGATLAPIIR